MADKRKPIGFWHLSRVNDCEYTVDILSFEKKRISLLQQMSSCVVKLGVGEGVAVSRSIGQMVYITECQAFKITT